MAPRPRKKPNSDEAIVIKFLMKKAGEHAAEQFAEEIAAAALDFLGGSGAVSAGLKAWNGYKFATACITIGNYLKNKNWKVNEKNLEAAWTATGLANDFS